MTPQFNIKFLIDRVNETLNLVLTDLSDYSGVSTYYGFYEIIYPDGVVVGNTDESNPDFENGNAETIIPLRTRNGLIEGEYSITQKTFTDIGDDELEKIFTFSFADPSLIMRDNSNLVTPSVSFLDITQYVNTGYNSSVTRSIECDFPTTSEVSDSSITSTAIEIFMLKDGKSYEGIYKPKLTATALFTADEHEIEWIQSKSFEFDVRKTVSLEEVSSLMGKVKYRLDHSTGNVRDLMDDYFMVTSLYTQLIAKQGVGVNDSSLKKGSVNPDQFYFNSLNNLDTLFITVDETPKKGSNSLINSSVFYNYTGVADADAVFSGEEGDKKHNTSLNDEGREILSGIFDSNTREFTQYEETDTFSDGSAISNDKLDDVIYRKLGDTFFKRVVPEKINIKWFGAKGDGVTDDTEAVKKAISSSVSYSYSINYGTFPPNPEVNGYNIYFPPGKYRVTSSLTDLSEFNIPDGRKQGVTICGIRYKSIIFADLGEDNYLFDNFTGTPTKSYIGLNFENISIYGGSNPSTASSFMRVWSDGQSDKMHSFSNCIFSNLKTVMSTEGSANADIMVFNNCRFSGIYTSVMKTNNIESVCHSFYQCEILACFCDAVFHSIYGGNITWNGGSIINGYSSSDGGKDSMQYLFKIEKTSHGNNRFIISNTRIEVPSIYMGLVEILNEAGATTSRVTFQNVNFSGVKDPETPREVLNIGGRQVVEFLNCQLPIRSASNAFVYSLSSTQNEQGASIRPLLKFISSEIPIANPDSFIFPEDPYGGRVVANDCYNGDANIISSVDPIYAMDFSFPSGFGGCGIYSSGVNIHRVALFRTGTFFPRDSASGFNEKKAVLPHGVTILKIYVYHPPQGDPDGSLYQLHVGNNDKTTTYGSSISDRYDAEHKILINDASIVVGENINNRTVRLWADPVGGTGSHVDGFAYIEYV